MAAPAHGAPAHDDGMDILKFFIAIMSFLTVLVGGMAVYNWSRATGLAEEIENDQANLEMLRRLGGSQELRDLIAKERASKDQVDVLKKDLGEHLQQTAARMGITLLGYEKKGNTGYRQQGFDKASYSFTLDKLTLDNIVEYLFYLQASWPGLKIEELSVVEAQRAKREDPFNGWKATIIVSIFRPKA